MELLKTLDAIAADHNKPVAQKSFVGTALTGVQTPEQAAENCATFDWSLTDEEIARIDAEIARLGIG